MKDKVIYILIWLSVYSVVFYSLTQRFEMKWVLGIMGALVVAQRVWTMGPFRKKKCKCKECKCGKR